MFKSDKAFLDMGKFVSGDELNFDLGDKMYTIDAVLADWRAAQEARARQREAEARLAALTPRERDILDGIAAGLGNKAIARRLALSPRTVEVHRANIMRRAGAGNVAELLRLQFTAEHARAAPVDRVRFGA